MKSLSPLSGLLVLSVLFASCTSVTTVQTVATPAFSVSAGSYTSSVALSITSSTSGASIRYTTDGSAPTSSSGTLYSAAITISSTQTIKAIAFKTGWNDSEVASATYTISSSPSTYSYSKANPLFEVDFSGSSSMTLTVSGAEGSSVYLVKANPSSSFASASTTGKAASATGSEASSIAAASSSTASYSSSGRPTRYEHAAAAEFNANPPAVTIAARGIAASASVSYGGGGSGLVVDSSAKSFWVENSSGAWVQKTATLRAVGRYCYVWVADECFSASSTADNDNAITGAQAAAIQAKFDGSSAASWTDGIFKNVTSIFGYEYGGGAGGSGGCDGDQHIVILVYDIGGDYISTQTGGVLGYFWGKDYYDQTTLDSYYGTDTYKTNYSEIFYVDTHFTDKYPSYILSTLAHEYQHMINFNRKTVENGLSSPSWCNEMCSMVAEDLVDANIGLDPATDGPISRFPEFAYHYAESGVTDWSSSLKNYAGAFAFGAYLERNYGGASLFEAMSDNSSVGTTSITAALSSLGYSDTFDAAFLKYGQALVFTDQPTGASVKSFKQESAVYIDSMKFTAQAIDLDTVQQYDLSAGSSTGSYGIRLYDPSTMVELRPYGYSVHSRTAWQNLSGSLSLTLTAPTDSDVKFYIMVK